MKEQLCHAFCGNLQVRDVPIGLAVSTAFSWADGDRIGFYIAHNTENDTHRIEDSGLLLTFLRAGGFNIKTAARENALDDLLSETGVMLDRDDGTFYIDDLTEADVPSAAMRFMAFLMRSRDLLLLAEPRVATTFREDVARQLAEQVGSRATISRDEPVAPTVTEFKPDYVVRAPERAPVGVFLGTSDARVLEALFVHMRAKHVLHVPCVIVTVIEREKNISSAVRQQASNHLDAVTYYRGHELEAIQRVADEALGETVH